MSSNPKDKPTRGSGAESDVESGAPPFDAVSAAAELADVLGTGAEANTGLGSSAYVSTLESEVLELSALIEKRDARIAHLEDEIERVRVRVEKDAENTVRRGQEKILLDVLEIIDDLDRAISAARDMNHKPAVVDGIELVRRGVLQRLAARGVAPMPAAGARFDPELHEAVAAVPVTNRAQAGVIVGVVREGYSIADRVLRAAQVAVGKAN